MFITFEGVDGAGKTEQAQRLARLLDWLGHDVVVTREPGGTGFGETVREWLIEQGDSISPLTQALVFNAARAHLVDTVIRPALNAGKVVLCDRFADSTTVYQGLVGGAQYVEALSSIAMAGAEPNVTVWLSVPPKEALWRIQERGAENAPSPEHITNVVYAYDALADMDSHRIVEVDGVGEIHEVAERVRDAVKGKAPHLFESTNDDPSRGQRGS